MDDPHRRDPTSDSVDRPGPGRIIDVSGDEPVIVEGESSFPYISSGAERVRVYTATGGARTCAIPLIIILLLLCCTCVAVWSLTDNIF